jgi:transcriptional regulator with XRE-family HTH domain
VATLKPARLDAGLTLEQIAARIGLGGKGAHAQASRVERGVKPTTTDRLQLWLDACGCDVYIVPRDRTPGAAATVPLVAALDVQRRALLLRIARLMAADPAIFDRLTHDVEYLERTRSLPR